LAINIMTTFIHNEPTSLHVLQEARLPEIFYSAIESGLEPVMEVIQSVPNAIGALCLNQAGVDQLVDRPEVLGRFFEIFTTEKHVKLLQEKDNAVIVGSAIDELIRHHPALGARIFTAIVQTLEKIEAMGMNFEEEPGQSHMYHLVVGTTGIPTTANSSSLDQDASWNQHQERTPMEIEGAGEGGSDSGKVENMITTSFDVFNRVSFLIPSSQPPALIDIVS
jgi:E3 ubiquitin-protein ligase HUWE1